MPKGTAKPKNAVLEKVVFKPDEESDAPGKNMKLATYLQTSWCDLEIVTIERIEIGSTKGWRATYRE